MPQQIEQGNVTCNGKLVFGEYEVASGDTCQLYCRPGFVSLELKQTRCLSGRWSRRLACVRPDAMLIIGGRSNTQGVLNTVELVTGKGVCRGAVPELPAMRWRMVANSIDNDRVLACGGTNIFGDPKRNCWVLGFETGDPRWTKAGGQFQFFFTSIAV